MPITALSDAELIEQARGGDEAAFTELYVRHQPAALRLARTYRRLGDPDELVNGAFERVLGAIKRGSGPTESFRAYLFVTLRRYAAEKASKPDEESLDDVPEPISEAADSPALAQADRALISEAFESLPDRWQAVLWHTAVEGQQPRELAGVLGVSANAASAMAYRAREKLRQAYLQAHLLASPAPDHEPYRSQLGAYVRGGLSPRDTTAVEKHLEGCESCRALVAELEDVNRSLARAVLPLFLLVGGGKLGGALVGGAAAGAAADKGGATGLFDKIKNAAPTVGSAAAIAAVVGGMIGMGSAVARQDSGPLNSAADAADLGASDDGNGSSSGRDDDSDSLFGDEDFALSPFDDEAGADFDSEFGDDFGFGDDFDDFSDFDDFGDDFGFPRSRSPRLPSTNGGSGGPGGGTGGAPGPGPVSPPPATPPPNPPTPPPTTPPTNPPAPVTFASSGWAPNADDVTGTLQFGVGEASAAPASSTLAAFVSPTAAPLAPTATPLASSSLHLRVTLAGGAQFPAAGLPAGCVSSGGTIDCTFQQMPAGRPGPTFSLPVVLGSAATGQSASAQIFRVGNTQPEASLPSAIPLERYAAGLSLGEPAVSPLMIGERPLPAVQTDLTVTNSGSHAVTSAAVVLTSTGDSAFVPTGSNVDAAVKALAVMLGDSAGAEALRAPLTTPLPSGCVADKPPPTDWGSALRTDGLPHTVTCTIGPVAPGASVSLPDILALGYPAFFNGNGRPEQGTVTATLSIGPRQLGEPRSFELPWVQESSARIAAAPGGG